MTPIEITVFAATGFGLVSSFVGPLRFDRAYQSIGRTGIAWFANEADRTYEELVLEDEQDAPIPVRPLRGRTP